MSGSEQTDSSHHEAIVDTVSQVDLPRRRRKEILFEQAMTCVSRVVSGVVLIALAYIVLDTYRQRAAYANVYSEHRLQQLTSLWAATDRHGIEVLKALADTESARALSTRLQHLGESYYLELTSVGLFLGQERIGELRTTIGDIYLDHQEDTLTKGSTVAKVNVVKEFRVNWITALKELETLGLKRGR